MRVNELVEDMYVMKDNIDIVRVNSIDINLNLISNVCLGKGDVEIIRAIEDTSYYLKDYNQYQDIIKELYGDYSLQELSRIICNEMWELSRLVWDSVLFCEKQVKIDKVRRKLIAHTLILMAVRDEKGFNYLTGERIIW